MQRLSYKARNLKRMKPPKLRFKPGQFFLEKKTGELYCVRCIFRLVSEPHEWRYWLEERKDLHTPQTKISRLVEQLTGKTMNDCIVVYEPVDSSLSIPGTDNFYRYGDIKVVTNKQLLNEYKLVSSGELL